MSEGKVPKTVEIWERRARMLELSQQLKPTEILAVMRKEGYSFSDSVYWSDWSTRNEWMKAMVEISANMDDVAAGILRDIRESKRKAYDLYLRAETAAPSAAVGALKEYNSMLRQEIEFFQHLGKLPKVAEKYDVSGPGIIAIKFSPDLKADEEPKDEE